LEEVIQTDNFLMLLMEYAGGEELFSRIIRKKRLPEQDAAVIFVQILKALYYLHENNIIHRDIKPENIVIQESQLALVRKDTNEMGSYCFQEVKLIDFGLSKHVGEGGSSAKTFVGTPAYVAPEVHFARQGANKKYGPRVDCFSAGVVLHVMLVGRFPEYYVDPSNIHSPRKLKLDGDCWEGIDGDVKGLVAQLMQDDENLRLTIRQALQHPWILTHVQPIAQTARELGAYDPQSFGSIPRSMRSMLEGVHTGNMPPLPPQDGERAAVLEGYNPPVPTQDGGDDTQGRRATTGHNPTSPTQYVPPFCSQTSDPPSSDPPFLAFKPPHIQPASTAAAAAILPSVR
jgi:serine/threonine protein kinase